MMSADDYMEALQAIPANVCRDEWVQAGMAARAAGLSEEDFLRWSEPAASFNERDARAAWNSFRGDGVSPGTLVHLAKQHGWEPAKRSFTARELWDAGRGADASHPYIARKRGNTAGLRVLPPDHSLRIKDTDCGGALLVPVRDPNGTLRTLQVIGTQKLNLPGHTFEDGFFLVGQPTAGQPIYICEGIGTAWACSRSTGHASAVTFGVGRFRRVTKVLSREYPASMLVLVPDRGVEEQVHKVAAELNARIVILPAEIPLKSDAADLADARGDDALAQILMEPAVPGAAFMARLSPATPPKDSQTSRDSQPAPEPLRRPVPAPEPYPLDELGDLLGPAARSLHRVIRAPDAICGASVLAAASLAAQGLADVENDGRVHPLSLWHFTVAESGERKTATDAEAMKAAKEFEKSLQFAYVNLAESHQAAMEEWEARREAAKAASKKRNGEGLKAALQDIGPAPAAPMLPKVIVGDFTAEGLAKLLALGRPSVGAFTDEAALVVGGHGMSKEAVMRTAATLSKLWDRGELDRVRAGDGAMKLYGRRLALHLMAQPVIADAAFSNPILAGQGFLARCLISWPSSTAGSRDYVSEDLTQDQAMRALHTTLYRIHSLDLPIGDGDPQELTPRRLALSLEARDTWRRLHDAVEAGMAPKGRFALVKAWASKTPEQCLRIAGVLTVVERPDATTIDASTVERAAEIALWHLVEASRMAGTATVSPEILDAEALLAWAHESGRSMLHSGAALRLGPSRIRERPRFDAAMQELERAGWAHKVGGGAQLDGAHRRHVWSIVPAAEGR